MYKLSVKIKTSHNKNVVFDWNKMFKSWVCTLRFNIHFKIKENENVEKTLINVQNMLFSFVNEHYSDT